MAELGRSNIESDGQNISDHFYTLFHQPADYRVFAVFDLARIEG